MIRSALLLLAITALGPNERNEVVETAAQLLEANYVSPEKGNEIAAALRSAVRSGAYDAATTAPALMEVMNVELRKANDRHLSVRLAPDGAVRASSPPSTGGPGPMRRRIGGGNPPDAHRMNYGFRGLEHLGGNVGYLDVGLFMDGPETRALADAAAAFLANSDAVIVDVRRCPGGSADGVSYLASYFFGPEQKVLMNRYHRASNQSLQSTTLPVGGKLMPDKDLYILTSARTGSACESFAYTLQQHGRAKLVGERTAGAGNNNAFMPIGYGLTLSISVGTAIHPVSGKGWEAVGVQPEIEVPADRALEAAQAEALRGLAAKSTDERRKRELSDAAPNAVAQVQALEREWLDAYEKRDEEAMKRIVADDFKISFPDGSSQTKADILAMLELGKKSGRPSPRFSTEGVEARAHGDTVVLRGRVVTEMKRPDGTTSRSEQHYTDTYVREGGRWQVVASHLSK